MRLARARPDATFGVSEIARELSKNKIYIIRLLSSLESIGWVTQDPVTRRYKVGKELVTIGFLLTAHLNLSKTALPYLYELSDITNETIALSVRIDYERLYVHQVSSKRSRDQSNIVLGQRNPLWLGATGMSMAAYLSDSEIDELVNIMRQDRPDFIGGIAFNIDQYRKDLKEIKGSGYALRTGIYIPDVSILAAPIFDHEQTVIGALTIRGKSSHFNLKKAKTYSALLIEKTTNITREMRDLT